MNRCLPGTHEAFRVDLQAPDYVWPDLPTKQGDAPAVLANSQAKAIEERQRAGGRMFGQGTTRSINAMFSLKSYLPFDVLPPWKKIRSLPLEEQCKRLRDPAVRRELIAAEATMIPGSRRPARRRVAVGGCWLLPAPSCATDGRGSGTSPSATPSRRGWRSGGAIATRGQRRTRRRAPRCSASSRARQDLGAELRCELVLCCGKRAEVRHGSRRAEVQRSLSITASGGCGSVTTTSTSGPAGRAGAAAPVAVAIARPAPRSATMKRAGRFRPASYVRGGGLPLTRDG